MYRLIFLTLTLLITFQSYSQLNQVNPVSEGKYGSPYDLSLPLWVRKMYDTNPNVKEVTTLYEEYYKTHEFVKSSHTQYYKRWKKNVANFTGVTGEIVLPTRQDKDRADQELASLKAKEKNHNRSITEANWSCIGPFDFDKDASGRSHAPGAAHVYALEKAPSNANIIYAGTANAGVWKSIDNGLNWSNVTMSIPFQYCNSLEIHPTDPNTVWFGGNDRIYKSTDGGTSWNVIGDASFNLYAHSTYEIVLKPGNTNVLFVSSNKGLFRSLDGGSNFEKVLEQKDGYVGEIEFKPNDANTMYVVINEVADKYSELYKSTDGGTTWTIVNSWPVIASGTNYMYQTLHRPIGSSYGHVSYTNDNLGTATHPNFTIEMRVKFPSSFNDKAVLSNKNYSTGLNNGWMIGANTSSKLRFNISNGTTRIDLNATNDYFDDQWHQVSAVYRATGLKELYVDGIQIATSSTNITIGSNTGLPMILGKDGLLNYGSFPFSVDEFRIWKTALTATEINSWKNIEVNNTHTNYSNLLHYYKCNIISGGTTILDEQGTNHGTVNGTFLMKQTNFALTTTSLTGTDHQKRAELSVTAANPNKIYALLAGSANGGSGLFGFYSSIDNGTSWTHKCCGTGPGGNAVGSPTASQTTPGYNENLLGYSETGGENGGQYYYDLAMDADPNNSNKVHIAGINHWYTSDGGNTFKMTAKWSWPQSSGYVHADIHNIKVYGNEVWIVNDGGVFMSSDSGKVAFNKRQYGIAGTDFWGFGMGHKDANVMLGGTYHNSHLMKNNNVYINGWISYTGSADGTRGFVNPGKDKEVYNDGGRELLPAIRTQSSTPLIFSMNASTAQPQSKFAYDPRCYNCMYTGNGTVLWYTESDGASWTAIKDFTPYNVGDIEVAWDNPNIIYVAVGNTNANGGGQIWKSIDKGVNWIDITPSIATFPNVNDMYFQIEVGDHSNDIWFMPFHKYGWYSSVNKKVFYSNNSGASWNDWTTSNLYNQNMKSMFYQRGSNGGIYVTTSSTVFYRDNITNTFNTYSSGLPAEISGLKILPWYWEGKLRLASDRSVWESPMATINAPIAQPMCNKLTTYCGKDTIYLRDYGTLYNKDAEYQWNITPSPQWTYGLTTDKPKVVLGNAEVYQVSLTVIDSIGTSTESILNGITVMQNNCGTGDTIPGKAHYSTITSQYSEQEYPLNITSNTITMMAWVKRTINHTGVAGIIFGRGGTTSASGLNLDNNNTLRYHWNDGQWGFNTGFTLPVNEWSHVALVVSPDNAKIYFNGKEVTNSNTHDPVNFADRLRIGNDAASSSRTFIGYIDEVSFYNKSMSAQEIRELMHLTRNPTSDQTLKAYYQFNDNSPYTDSDKVGNNYLNHGGNMNKQKSTAPVGKGVSQTLSVTTGGLKNFVNADAKIYFPISGTFPNGNIVVTKINQLPDTFPTAGILPNCYWVVNNFGTNQSFTLLDSMIFFNSGNISGGCTPNMYQLKKRSFNGEGIAAYIAQDDGDFFSPYSLPKVTYATNNNTTSFNNQYLIFNSNKVSADPEVCNGIDDNCNGIIDENVSLIVTNVNDNGAGSLRQTLNCAVNGDTIRFAANVDTITLTSTLTLTKTLTFHDAFNNNVVLKLDLNQVGFANEGIQLTNTADVKLININMLELNNSFTKPLIRNNGKLTLKDCTFSGNPKVYLLNTPSSIYTVEGIVEVK